MVSLMAASAGAVTVTSSADSGGTCPGADCTLRQAIATAPAGDTIDFAPGLATITLTSGELFIDKALTIVGPGAGALTVQRSSASGTPPFRIIDINSGFANFSISGLTLSNGSTDSASTGGNVGGGILCVTFGTVTITGCNISGNAAGGGGGLFKSGGGGTANVNNCTFSGNSAVTTGGGVYNSGSGNFGIVNLVNCTISGNSAHDAAGIFNTGKVNLTYSTVSGNFSNAGAASPNGSVGAIYNRSTLNVTNSTISGNSVTDSSGVGAIGGGIYNYSGGTINLTNATISGNSTSSTGSLNTGGGVYNDFGTVNSKNTIIARNTAPIGPDFYGSLTTQGYNLIGDGSNTSITATTGDQIGTSTSPIDPMLGPLQNNGGPTFTQELLTGSSAIDAGATAIDPATNTPITTDQRGFTRPVDNPSIVNAPSGDGSDIGAFELQPDTPTPTPTASPTATATPTATPANVQLLNISGRLFVQTEGKVGFAGFILQGGTSKRILIRAMGPSLQVSGNSVAGSLQNPVLELHGNNGVLLSSNDSWRSDQETEIQQSGLAPGDDREAALIANLGPETYTAVIRGVNGSTGIGTVEIYDLEATVPGELANLSVRGDVRTDDDVLIAGLILRGGTPKRVVFRAIGPTLAAKGVPDSLQNPTLDLHDGNGALLFSNDDWRQAPNAGEIESADLAPSDDRESAVLMTLTPDNYTAIVRGVNRTTGIALAEAYKLD